ncbi:MAG TPA: RNA polymerase sigma factor [Candidatus Lumbricidophila sp.]|nr:RNA polymerase sigma factor [Candidatus Lumbricidophila sp.]
MSIQGDQPFGGDGELLFRLSRGDERAYRQLHNAHGAAVYRAALVLVRKPWDAEEVAATAFFELWRKRADVRLVDDSILPWLLTVTAFVAKNQLRSTFRYSRLLRRIPSDGPAPDHADEVAENLDDLRISHDVRNALRDLNPKDASVLLLCVVHELPVKDAALALGIPEGTVKSRLSRVKSRLRVSLQSYAPSAEGVEG